MSRKIIYTIFLILCGCVLNTTDVLPSKITSDFYHNYLSSSEQIRQIRKYNLEQQYNIYIFGNQVVHPPAIYLAEPFAEDGAIIISFLRKKLEDSKEEATIRDIAQVFLEIARLKLYDFSAYEESLILLSDRANEMKGIWKKPTLEIIAKTKSYTYDQ